jgi:3D (Asp-Asp-Asp) domain-containing protein
MGDKTIGYRLGLWLLVLVGVAALGVGGVLLWQWAALPGNAIAPELAAVTSEATRPVTLPATVVPPSPAPPLAKKIVIEDGGAERSVQTTAATVGEALAEADVRLGDADAVVPAPDTPLTAGLRIEVQRAMPVTIAVDGRELEVLTLATEPHAVLAGAGVGLLGFDYLRAPAALQPGDSLEVVRVTEQILLEEEPIPFETVYQADATMALDTQAVTSVGTPGLLRRRIRVRSENGVETGRELQSEWVARPPTNQVINYGTAITIRTLDTPEGPIEYWRVVRMHIVAYTPSSAGKSPGEPGYGITASGLPAGKGVAAVDPGVIPFRSRIYVPGYGVAVAGDTGGGVRGRMVDLGYPDDGYVHWSRAEDVYYLTPVPENITYILP